VQCAQARTGGITEFVPLPFVHMEAPIYLKGMPRHLIELGNHSKIHKVSC
jgi:FO synthase